MKLGMYIMAPEPISTAYFIDASHQSVRLYVYADGNVSVKTLPRQRIHTHASRIIVGRVLFCAVRVVSKESLWICLCIPLSFLGNGSVNTFPRQRGIVGGVVFYAVSVVSKESKLLVLPGTICFWNTTIALLEECIF
jgi:hypothetical protein